MAPTTSFMSVALLASTAAALPFGFNFGGSGGPQHGAPWSSWSPHEGQPKQPEPSASGSSYPGPGDKPPGIPLFGGQSPAPTGYVPTSAGGYASPTGFGAGAAAPSGFLSAIYNGAAFPTGAARPTNFPFGTGAFGIPSSAGAPFAPDATQWSRPVPPEEQGKPSEMGPGANKFEGPRHWDGEGGHSFGPGQGEGFARPSGVAFPSGDFAHPSGAGAGFAQPTGLTKPFGYPGAGQQQHGPPEGGEQHGSPFGGQQHGPPAGFNAEAFPL